MFFTVFRQGGFFERLIATGNVAQGADLFLKFQAETAIDGFCPVCVLHGKLMKGNDNFVTVYEGKKYKFVGFEEQKMFIENLH